MNTVAAFEKELRARVSKRDPNATVHIGRSLASAFTGEYICVIETLRERNVFAFNPENGTWVVVYEQ